MSSCFTSTSASALITGIPQCSGHGVCDEPTGTCVCDPMWMGASDIFDMNGLDCQVSRVTNGILWGMVILAWLPLWKDHYLALKVTRASFNELRQRKLRSKGEKMSAFTYPPFITLVPGLFLVCPGYIIIAGLRIGTNRVTGADPLMTWLTAFVNTILYISVQATQTNMVRSLIRGVSRDPRLLRVATIHDYLWTATTFWMIATTVLPAIIALYLPPLSLSNFDSSARTALVLIRNLGTIGYVFMLYFTARIVVVETSKLVDTLKGNSPDAAKVRSSTRLQPANGDDVISPGSPKNAPEDKLTVLLNGLHDASDQAKKKAIVAVLIYLVFCIPPLWTSQNYTLGIAFFLVALGNATPARYYLTSKRDDSKSGTDPSSGAKSDNHVVPHMGMSSSTLNVPNSPTALKSEMNTETTFQTSQYES